MMGTDEPITIEEVKDVLVEHVAPAVPMAQSELEARCSAFVDQLIRRGVSRRALVVALSTVLRSMQAVLRSQLNA